MRKKTALNHQQLSAAKSAIVMLARRMAATLPMPKITPSQGIDLITPIEHRNILKQAPSVCSLSQYYLSSDAKVPNWPGVDSKVAIHLNFRGEVLPPKFIKVQEDADPELVEAITHWVNFRLSVTRDFGRAYSVVDTLDDVCNSPAQFRYVWPSLLALFKMNTSTEAIAEEIGELKQPKTMPSLSGDLREACRLAASTVTSALLLDEAPQEKKPRNGIVTITVPQLSYVEPFRTFNALDLS